MQPFFIYVLTSDRKNLPLLILESVHVTLTPWTNSTRFEIFCNVVHNSALLYPTRRSSFELLRKTYTFLSNRYGFSNSFKSRFHSEFCIITLILLWPSIATVWNKCLLLQSYWEALNDFVFARIIPIQPRWNEIGDITRRALLQMCSK